MAAYLALFIGTNPEAILLQSGVGSFDCYSAVRHDEAVIYRELKLFLHLARLEPALSLNVLREAIGISDLEDVRNKDLILSLSAN